MLLQELNRDITVRFDVSFGQIQLVSQPLVVVQNAVMGKCKSRFTALSEERVIVEIQRFVALCSHSRVPENHIRAERQTQVQAARGLWSFVD